MKEQLIVSPNCVTTKMVVWLCQEGCVRQGRRSSVLEWVWNFGTSASAGDPDAAQVAGPRALGADAVGLGQDRRTCVSNKFPGKMDTAGPGTTVLSQYLGKVNDRLWFSVGLML